jgi:hypothetical protein
MRRQKEGFAVPSDAEWSTYDVILLSSRLGARPNPLANWKHAIFCYWVVGEVRLFCCALAVETFGEKIRAEVTANAIGSCDDMEDASC